MLKKYQRSFCVITSWPTWIDFLFLGAAASTAALYDSIQMVTAHWFCCDVISNDLAWKLTLEIYRNSCVPKLRNQYVTMERNTFFAPQEICALQFGTTGTPQSSIVRKHYWGKRLHGNRKGGVFFRLHHYPCLLFLHFTLIRETEETEECNDKIKRLR